MDVCLSFTKYHKEEWQAAWTISTMLNAIIAFFPVKETHDAIGSIDYPIETRKKFAIQSKKWKCNDCGVIGDILPEKKVEIINNNVNQEETEDNAKDDKSENSNPVVENSTISSENPNRKKEKTNKLKKLDLDRRSIIEGVIFEDLNEDTDNEGGNPEMEIYFKNRALSKDDAIDGDLELNKAKSSLPQNQNQNRVENINTTLKRHHSDIQHSQTNDFNDYFKRLRQSQFESEFEVEETDKNIKTQTISAENPDDKIKTEKKAKESKNLENKYLIPSEEQIRKNQNVLINSTYEEIEFCEALKSLKFHKSKTTEEIIIELQEESQKSDSKDDFLKLLNKLIDKDEKTEKIESLPNQDTINPEQYKTVMNYLTLLKKKGKLDSLVKQKNNMLKYYSKKTYKAAKVKRLRCVNIIMVLLIIGIFGIYHYIRINI